MKFRILFILAFVVLFGATQAHAEQPSDALRKLSTKHPRLLFSAQREAELKKLRKTDPVLDSLVKSLVKTADKMVPQPVTEYKIPDGRRLLQASRSAIDRVMTLSFAFRMTGEKKYAEAATAEMLAVCKFKDWNPSHFLDTAEMAFAVAVGYDWLYDELSAKQRKAIEQGLIENGLNAGLKHYERNYWWVKGDNNWNQVCNGGMLAGAIAMNDVAPEAAKKIFDAGIPSAKSGIAKMYTPDGAYPEGPGYWVYGTGYTVLTIMALNEALGTDFGLSQTEGLDKTGEARVGTTSPNGKLHFNYADGGAGSAISPAMFALTTIYKKPFYADWHRVRLENWLKTGDRPTLSTRFRALEAIWYLPQTKPLSQYPLPRANLFRGIQDVATLYSSRSDPNAMCIAIKGGNNRANHGHLDIGTFVLDWQGVRWAVDLGSDNYNMPGYFGGKRWTYYRLVNASHNTLVIDGKNQNTSAVAPATLVDRKIENQRVALVNMSEAYKGQTAIAYRRATLETDANGKNPTVTLTDELAGLTEGSEIRWGMVTEAQIKISDDGQTAILTQEGKKLRVEIDGEAGQKFEIGSTKPPQKIEKQNTGTRMLVIKDKAPEEGTKFFFSVLFRGE